MPRAPLSGSVIANSTMYLATGPEVIQLFLPLMTKRAVGLLDRAAAHGGGVGTGLRLGQREGADLARPRRSARTYFCFCASVPYFRMPLQNSELLTDMMVECAASAAAISIIAST